MGHSDEAPGLPFCGHLCSYSSEVPGEKPRRRPSRGTCHRLPCVHTKCLQCQQSSGQRRKQRPVGRERAGAQPARSASSRSSGGEGGAFRDHPPPGEGCPASGGGALGRSLSWRRNCWRGMPGRAPGKGSGASPARGPLAACPRAGRKGKEGREAGEAAGETGWRGRPRPKTAQLGERGEQSNHRPSRPLQKGPAGSPPLPAHSCCRAWAWAEGGAPFLRGMPGASGLAAGGPGRRGHVPARRRERGLGCSRGPRALQERRRARGPRPGQPAPPPPALPLGWPACLPAGPGPLCPSLPSSPAGSFASSPPPPGLCCAARPGQRAPRSPEGRGCPGVAGLLTGRLRGPGRGQRAREAAEAGHLAWAAPRRAAHATHPPERARPAAPLPAWAASAGRGVGWGRGGGGVMKGGPATPLCCLAPPARPPAPGGWPGGRGRRPAARRAGAEGRRWRRDRR